MNLEWVVISDSSSESSVSNISEVHADICQECNGSGFSNKAAEKCDCVGVSCMKCENNEGYIIHPFQSCDACCGTGSMVARNQVLCISSSN